MEASLEACLREELARACRTLQQHHEEAISLLSTRLRKGAAEPGQVKAGDISEPWAVKTELAQGLKSSSEASDQPVLRMGESERRRSSQSRQPSKESKSFENEVVSLPDDPCCVMPDAPRRPSIRDSRSSTGSKSFSSTGSNSFKRGLRQRRGDTDAVVPVEDSGSLQQIAEKNKPNVPTGDAGPVPPKRKVFVDVDEIKDKARKAILRTSQVSGRALYKKSGICQKIANSMCFEQLTLLAIALNAAWIAIETDINNEEILMNADVGVQIIEHLFCVFFVGELAVRFAALEEKLRGLRDRWFIFDTVLVVLMVLELWVMNLIMLATGTSLSDAAVMSDASVLRLLRLLRLARIARMARLFRAFPELMIMMKGLFIATRSVMITFFMLLLVVYIFAIAFRQMLNGYEVGDEYFSSIFVSMRTLVNHGVLLDSTATLINALGDTSIMFQLLFFLFVMVAPFTMLNMLIGVLCQTVSMVSEVEQEEALVSYTKEKLLHMLSTSGIDENGDNLISQEEFNLLVEIPEAALAVQHLGVDVVALVELQDFIFAEETEMCFTKFMELVLQLRGSNHATVKDIVDLRRYMASQFGSINR